MNESTNRIACEKCGAANFPSSANCWQCGETLQAARIRVERPEGEEPTPPSEPTPTPPPNPEPAPVTPPPPEPQSSPPVYTPPVTQRDTENMVIIGFVLAGLGFFGCCCCFSPLFSIAAIILGATVYSRGDQRGLWVIIAGVVALLFGGISLIWTPWGRHVGPWNGPFPGPLRGPWRNI